MMSRLESISLVEVVIPRRIHKPFHYSVPERFNGRVCLGSAVKVPFGRREEVGFVVGFPPRSEHQGIKEIQNLVREQPFFNAGMLDLVGWVSQYYNAPLGLCLKTALPSFRSAPSQPDGGLELTCNPEQVRDDTQRLQISPRQTDLLRYLSKKTETVTVRNIRNEGFSQGTIDALLQKGLLRFTPVKNGPSGKGSISGTPLPDQNHSPEPTEEQSLAIALIQKEIRKTGFHPFLLHGITGSGKTEVYIRSIQETLALGKAALFLVPEIGLTASFIERLKKRLNVPVAVLHSGLTSRERWQAWEEIQTGKVRVALGVRSAVFAPFPDLGLIVVDEEQDGSYKQEEGLRYNARDVALLRAQRSGATVILGSATPSLESYYHSQAGKYHYIQLTKRIDHRSLPEIRIIDLRQEGLEGDRLLSSPLVAAIEDRLKAGEQTLLFLNRRGFQPGLLCRDCGFTFKCPNCSVGLVLYRKGSLLCHYCDFEKPPSDRCPQCKGVRWGGLGGGTERLEEEVRATFPQARILRMDRDTTRKKDAYKHILKEMEEGRCGILVGTQMISKGHDFPGITLVGIVMADIGLSLPDFRAAERLFQIVTQVSGRSGRGNKPGEVLIQTFNPDSPILMDAARHDCIHFYEEELLLRKKVNYPPFCRLVLLVLQGNAEKNVQCAAEKLETWAKETQIKYKPTVPIEVLGPAPAPIEKIRGKYRYQLLIKGKKIRPLHLYLNELVIRCKGVQWPRGVDLIVDVDPQSFL